MYYVITSYNSLSRVDSAGRHGQNWPNKRKFSLIRAYIYLLHIRFLKSSYGSLRIFDEIQLAPTRENEELHYTNRIISGSVINMEQVREIDSAEKFRARYYRWHRNASLQGNN